MTLDGSQRSGTPTTRSSTRMAGIAADVGIDPVTTVGTGMTLEGSQKLEPPSIQYSTPEKVAACPH
jgi:hypothetical protein